MTGLTHKRLVEVLRYDPETGLFSWAVKRKKCVVGVIAGSPRSDGYVLIRIDYARYYAHRLAWLYMTGDWPTAEVDHVDGDASNNRWGNLREATATQNMQNRRMQKNNRIGLKGVKRSGKRFYAMIQVNGASRYLGTFDTPLMAHGAYREAAEREFQQFARA